MMLILLLITALQAPATASSDPRLYTVGPNDVLTITVYNQPQLSGKFAIEADGTLAYPLLGRVAAGGLSIRLVEDTIRGGLAKGFLNDPQVSVTVDQYPQPADLRGGGSTPARKSVVHGIDDAD